MLAAVAYADNVQNDVTAAGDIVSVTAGGSGVEVKYKIAANSGDGQSGCNANDGTAATVTPNVPTGVTKTPSSVTFANCDDQKGITFAAGAAVTPGDYEITVSVADGGVGSYNTMPAKFTLRVVAPSVAAPTVTKNAVGTPNHVSGSDTYVTSATQLGFTVTGASLTACTINIDGPLANDTSFGCVAGSNGYTLGGKLAAPPDGSYLNSASAANAGGTANDSFSVVLDDTAPTFGSCVGGPYLLNSGGGSQSVAITADDGSGSGVDVEASTLSGTVDTSSVGTKSVNYAANDRLGNSANTTCNYSVIYDWSGFFRPIDNLPSYNVVKAGQAVPVKFSLAGDRGLNILAAGYPKWKQVSCDPTAPADGVEETVTAGHSSLSYDALADQYTYVWKTDKAWATYCMSLQVKLDDNTSHYANFKFTK